MKLINETTAERRTSFPIALVVSQFNKEITTVLREGALQRLRASGFDDKDILVVEVPGAVEIPLLARRLAMQQKVEAIIALGAVIRGETSHYDYVCEQVSSGCQQVALQYNLPVVFGVLTTENEEQAWDRLGGQHGHKGVDAADCAIAMHTILGQL
ncbi:6,7-dimethyl-8-ribityllumazine synthase [Legionella spiritensis]|uniref:6,7-dimethyl-8-ribityllumazine synthase n=1 Tax=Legionella spiritensis TaxID=452 RepID=A0A0W0Z6T4_LEGSP|nr:6,7-dimethyl-8-ribityllumazine synthase [Legionella spiritensis]KTD64834.1 riboflavin synthase beta chain (6,7-dimethyl-8-ribityllumazine synthase) [Legionella spiritensis]SNV40452.1 riboflavin synthase subunit beta [Legionella spiritensis]